MRATLTSLSLLSLASAFAMNAAYADDITFPARKSGMWEIKMVQDQGGVPDMIVKACIDEASDRQMMAMGLNMSKSMCPEQKIEQTSEGYIIDATCDFGGMKSISRTVMTGDFQSSYKVDITSEMSGMPNMPGMASGPTKMTQTATWVGADCTDGLVPGDMQMPNGMKVNTNDMGGMLGGK